ncbi:MAG: hypothetical protein HQK65_09720 [Desulfamplus sp.]|nr:hypothetical protein [Desulfamplus sp.]
MGRVKSMFMDMQEDAIEMEMEEFIKNYGESNKTVWLDVRGIYDMVVPNIEEMINKDLSPDSNKAGL